MKTNKNKDIIPLDTPEGSEYDEMDIKFTNKDIIQLDTHKGHKNDKRKNESEYDTERVLKSENDNIESSALSFPCLTRESRKTVFRFAQSGRSMVEMLGTLAIIGVLSIGGIMGYSYAMDRYYANRTMQDVTLRGIDVLAQFDRTGDANLNEWQNEKTIYPITLEEDTIGIQVDEVPERVCEMMTEGMEHTATAIKINSAYIGEDNSDCGEDNTLVFYFDDNPIEDEGNINEPVQEQCGDTVCEQCFTCDEDTMTCVSVDSSESLLAGLGGIECTVDGQNGYCLEGACAPLHSSCEGLESGALCIQDGREGICFEEQCLALCSNPMGSCDAFGAKGLCLTFCVPLTDDGCHVSLAGQTEAIPDEWAFACERHGESGICTGGVCFVTDSVCADKEMGTTCTKNGENGYCLYGLCTPSEPACIEKKDGDTCTKDDKSGMCLFGSCTATCSDEGKACDAFGQDGVCNLILCLPVVNECNMEYLGMIPPIPDKFTFACGDGGYCANGVCVSRCTSNSDCTDGTKPFCRDDGVCVACTQDSHCGDTVSDYCQDNVCKTCSYSKPAWDAEKRECVECLDDSHCAYDYTYDDKPYCINRTCVQCTSHDHCEADQFCGDSNRSDNEANLGGSCYDLDYDSYTVTYTDTNGVSKTETLYVLAKQISWWDANSVCERLGKKLGKSLSMLPSNELVTDKVVSQWTSTRERTDLTKQLHAKMGTYHHFWTSDSYIIGIADGETLSRPHSFTGNILVSAGNALCR